MLSLRKGNMKVMWLIYFILLYLPLEGSTVLYNLNDSDYALMPPVFHLDPYESCLLDPHGLYCSVDLTLVSDTPSSLLTMIHEYSEHFTTHFNHTSLHHGYCVTKACKNHIKSSNMDLKATLEACLNETFSETYKLKVRISDGPYCSKNEDEVNLDAADIAVVGICAALLMVNIIGSCYDLLFETTSKDVKIKDNVMETDTFTKRRNIEDNMTACTKLLLCFSIKRNWNRLVAPPGDGPDPRLKRLIGINCLKAVTTVLMVAGHSLMVFVVSAANPQFIEQSYHNVLWHIMYDGTMTVQLFFILSGFWTIYNLQLFSEKHEVTWKAIPKCVAMRWLRLTPGYALTLAVTSTLFRYAGQGPDWQRVVVAEAESCRTQWWRHILYINNYFNDTQCMIQSWYLAADMQLSCLGIVLYVLLKDRGSKKSVLGLLMVIGMMVPALHTYLQDLDGTFIASPDAARTIFVWDRTFNLVYKRGHTNIACYTLGLALGYLVYHWQNNGFDDQKIKKLRYLVWAVVPVNLSLIMLASVFYLDGPRAPAYIRAIYAGLMKPTYGLLMTVLIFGIVFKAEELYRGAVEWRGWAAPARLSYGAVLTHMLFTKTYVGSHTTLHHVSFYHIVITFIAMASFTFLMSVPFFLLVEAPLGQVVKMCMMPKETQNRAVGMKNTKPKAQ